MTDAIKFDNIPKCLKDLHQWVLWKTVEKKDGPTKLPFQVTGAAAESNNPMTWASYDDAREKFLRGGYDGIGFMFTEGQGYVGIDLDNCRNPKTGDWAAWAREIIQRFSTYIEMSPSKTGVKLFIRATYPFEKGRRVLIQDAPNMSGGIKKPEIETYGFRRYFTLTGWKLSNSVPDVMDCQEAFDWMVERYIKEEDSHKIVGKGMSTTLEERAWLYISKIDRSIYGQNGSGRAYNAACSLVIGYGMTPDEAYPVFKRWCEECTPPWDDEKEIWHKLNSADKEPGIRGLIRDATPHQIERMRVPVYRESKPEPEIKRTTLKQASFDYIEREKNGGGVLHELGLPDIDYAIGGGVEDGEMILIASRPSMGKSMCSQQTIYNFLKNGSPCLFVSLEMSPLMIGKRTNHYVSRIHKEHWQTRADVVHGELTDFWKDLPECFVIGGFRHTDMVSREVANYVKKEGVRYVVIDYAQMITSGNQRRTEDQTNVSQALKSIAEDNGIPTTVLCQMNRSIESRPAFVPVMSDLKDSGQFEQDADVILSPVWPHRFDSKNPPDEYLVYVLKVRNREINQPIVSCKFEPSRQRLVHSSDSSVSHEDAERVAKSDFFPDSHPSGGFMSMEEGSRYLDNLEL